jgi:hypothetical protein
MSLSKQDRRMPWSRVITKETRDSGQVRWFMLVIPGTPELELGGL